MTPEDMFFFFSSRRRHTRSLCDWSSDVCSSDLKDGDNILLVRRAERAHTDVERAVVPEDIVLQLWIRNALARPVRCRRLEMARRANHSERRGEIRRQDRAVLDGHQTRWLRTRCRRRTRATDRKSVV